MSTESNRDVADSTPAQEQGNTPTTEAATFTDHRGNTLHLPAGSLAFFNLQIVLDPVRAVALVTQIEQLLNASVPDYDSDPVANVGMTTMAILDSEAHGQVYRLMKGTYSIIQQIGALTEQRINELRATLEAAAQVSADPAASAHLN